MPERFTAPVAELYAIMGLDTRMLDEQLLQTKVKLEDLEHPIVTVNQAFDLLAKSGVITSRSLQDLGAAIQLLYEQQSKAAEASRLEADSIEATAIAAQHRIEITEAEIASRTEYSNLVKQLQAEEIAANEALLESYERENEEMTRLDVERIRVLEQRTAAAEKAAVAESLGGMAGAGGGGFGRGTYGGLRLGPGGLTPFLRLGAFGPLMDIILPATFVALAIDLVADYGKKIGDAIDALEGFGKANRDAWEEANKGAQQAALQANKYLEALERAHTLSIATMQGRAGAESANLATDLTRVGQQQASYRELVNVLRNTAQQMQATQAQLTKFGGVEQPLGTIQTPEGIVQMPTGGPLADLARARGDNLNTIMTKLSDAWTHLLELNKQAADLGIKKIEDENKAARETAQHFKRWHDEVHELPNRLPFYLTEGHTGYGAAITNIQARPIMAPSGVITTRVPPRSPSVASPPQMGKPGASIVIQNTYSPSFNFDGVPADIQHFVRDELEPMIITDLQKNSRGFTADMVKALQAAGIRATN